MGVYARIVAVEVLVDAGLEDDSLGDEEHCIVSLKTYEANEAIDQVLSRHVHVLHHVVHEGNTEIPACPHGTALHAVASRLTVYIARTKPSAGPGLI